MVELTYRREMLKMRTSEASLVLRRPDLQANREHQREGEVRAGERATHRIARRPLQAVPLRASRNRVSSLDALAQEAESETGRAVGAPR